MERLWLHGDTWHTNPDGFKDRNILKRKLQVKASLKVFEPKQTRYIKEQPKFDLALLHDNVLHIKDAMLLLMGINEVIK